MLNVKSSKQHILLILLACNLQLATCNISAQEPTIGVETKISEKQTINLGEPFEVEYILTLPKEAKLDLSSWKANVTQWGSFTLWDFQIKSEPKENLQKIDLKIKLIPFTLGDAEIPDLQIPYKKTPSDNSTYAIATSSVPVKITDPTANVSAKGPRDIKNPRKPLYFWEHPIFILSAMFLAILGLLGLLFLYKAKRKKQGLIAQEELKRLSPEEAFHKSLGMLLQAGLLEERKYRQFYFGLSEIFRSYLDRRFKLDTEILTTRELLKLLHGKREELDIELSPLIQLKATLEIMDLVKFAKYAPDAAETTQVLEKLRSFIDTHQPRQPQEATTTTFHA